MTTLLRIMVVWMGAGIAIAPLGAGAAGFTVVEDVSSSMRSVFGDDAARALNETLREETVSEEDVRAATEEFFADRYPEMAARLRIRVVRLGSDALATAPLRIRPTVSNGLPRGHTQVQLLTGVDGEWSDAGWALLFVSHFDSVTIARRDIAAGQLITAEDAGAAWMDVTSFRGTPLRSADFEASIRAGELFSRHSVKAGTALRVDNVRPPFAAETGQPVTVIYKRGPIVMHLICKARESGSIGEVIRVYSDESKSTYKARLTGPGKADWISTL